MKNSKILIILSLLIMFMIIIPSSFAADTENNLDDSLDSIDDMLISEIDDDVSLKDTGDSNLDASSDLSENDLDLSSDSSDLNPTNANNDLDSVLSIDDSVDSRFKSLSSGVNVDDGISVNSASVDMVEGKSAYINGTLYLTGIYGGNEFTYFAVELTYSYVGDDGNTHSGTFETDDSDASFSLDLSQLSNLSKASSPYIITLSCEDSNYEWYNDGEYPDPVSVTVNVIENDNPDDPDEPVINPIIYVAKDGNDDTGNGSEELPYASIEKAVEVANAANEDYDIIVNEGTYELNSIMANNRNMNIIGLGDVIFDSDNQNYGFDTKYNFSIANVKFINVYGTSYGASCIKSTTSLGESLTVTNCTFINCTGYSGGAITTWYGGNAKLTVSNSTFINCVASYSNGGAIAVSYSKTANIVSCTFINNSANVYGGAIYFANTNGMSNVSNCVFIGNNAGTGYDDIYSTGSITADYSFWASNDKPGTDAVNSNVIINNWVYLDVLADLSKVAVDDTVNFNFDFTKYTDGTNNYSLENPIPEFDFTLVTNLGSFDISSLTTENNMATATYAAEEEGMETVTINGFDWEGISFEVIGNENNVIYVATNGSDSSGIGTEARPYATIEKALSQVTSTKNTIYIKKGTYNEYDLEIVNDVVIIGEDRDTTIINALNNGRIFIMSEFINVEIKSISLTNAQVDYIADDFERAGKGGAILVEYGNLILNNTYISNSKSAAGAVACIAGASGSLTVVDSIFENNIIDSDAYDIGFFDTIGGGAIYSDSILIVNNSRFINNVAQADGDYDEGGAIFAAASSIIECSIFEGNNAKLGGAIFIETYNNIEVNITHNQFNSNSANLGGAIYSSTSKLTNILNNVFDSNLASSNGGAIYVYGLRSVDLIDSNIFNNNRAKNGAGLYLRYANVTLNNNTMTYNKASNKGDTVYIDSAKVNTDLVFLNNDTFTALVGEETSLTASLTDDKGNPIVNGNISFKLDDTIIGTALTDNDGIATLNYNVGEDLTSYVISGTFNGNYDGISSSYPSTIENGILKVSKYYWFIGTQGYFTLPDAVDASEEGDIIIGLPGVYSYEEINIGHRVNRIYKNITIKAENLGDIILTGEGGRLFNVAYQFFGDDSHRPSALVLENLIIENCTDEYGGAIYNDAYLTLENCIFRNNKGTNADSSSKWHGGAIMNWGIMTINNCKFINNTATSGGAINTEAIHGEGMIRITNTIFEDNNVTDTGGAIYFAGYYDSLIENCSFTNNTAGAGGAIYTYNNLTVKNTPFMNNTAENTGGAIYQYHKSLALDNITVEGSAARWGGALFLVPALSSTISGDETVYQVELYNITNSRFNNNNATIDGGVIYAGYNFISTGFIKNSNFTNNNAIGYGGVISNQISNCTIGESNFINNSAGIGGAIYNNGTFDEYYGTEYASNVLIYNSVFENANASSDGGVIYNENQYSYVILKDSRFNNTLSGGYGGVIYNGGNLDLSNNTMENSQADVGNYIYNNGSLKTAYLTFMDNDTVEFNLHTSSSIDLTLIVTDDKNNSIVGSDIVFYVNGELASSKVDVIDGKTIYSYEITSPAEYLVSGVYSGSESGEYVVNTGLINAFMPNESTFVIDQSDLYVGDDFFVKLVDMDNNPIVGQTINVTIQSDDGTSEKLLITDANGQITISELLAGNYKIIGVFNGNNEYMESSFTYDLTINKFVPVLTFKTVGNEFIAILTNDSIALEGKELHIRLIDGKGITTTKNGQTDGNGALAISNLAKGNYLASVEFIGDEEFTQVSILETIAIDDETSVSSITHTGDDRKDIQTAIDAANPGDIIYLGDYDYTNVSDINITKDLTILGDDTTITSAGDGKAIFNIPSIANGGPSEVNIEGIDFKVNNGDVIVSANADNATNPYAIETAAINVVNNRIDLANDDVVAESVTVLELNSQRGILAPNNKIKVNDNTISAGVKPFVFDVTSFTDGSNVNVPIGGDFPEKLATVIEYEDMTTTAVDASIEPGTGEFFQITLKDSNGDTLANKDVQFGFNGKIYNKTTDENGIAKLQINLQRADIYTFAVSFQGDDQYNGSFAVAKITVKKQTPTLTVPNKSYKASAKTKTLIATFKSASGKVVANKKVTFTVNGKTYTATTNDKGVASVNVSLSTKKTYSFTAKFAGDNTYAAITKTAKVTIN